MPNRAAKLVSAVFASILAGTAFSTVSLGATPAADDCLSAPNAPVPDGSHWYYRIDRATKRHCWYIREQGEKLSQIRAPSPRSAKVKGQQAETTPQRSIADARAELPEQPSFEQPIRNDAPVATMRIEAPRETTEAVAKPDAQSQPSVVALARSLWRNFAGQSGAGGQCGSQAGLKFSAGSSIHGRTDPARGRRCAAASSIQIDPHAAGRNRRRAGARGHRGQHRSEVRRRRPDSAAKSTAAPRSQLGKHR